ncbi:MAG: glycosyltransferase family 4 protein [Saprospiraceae bacterium]|jgi:glycosyltransferase involved in cell wall biosynthesis|nr:glycosyltransferase family 4 protein [Saprospiraceae bacterium]
MKKVAWQTRSPLLFDCLNKNLLNPSANGGNAYDFYAAKSLSEKFDVIPDNKAVYKANDNVLSYWLRLSSHQPKAEVKVMEPYPVVFGSILNEGTDIAMIHHIDEDARQKSLKYKWFYKSLMKKLKKLDRVVTVSKYWKNYLEQEGCENVVIIYNSFNPSKYYFEANAIADFRNSLGFEKDKPLIYIGNAGNGKGVHEAYEALKDSPYQLVMTGRVNESKHLNVKFLNLPSREYRMLIASCDVVLAMSRMSEGWNRIAHEAMLCKVPVIGTGSGGMKELLEGGEQHISKNFEHLPDLVKNSLKNKDELGQKGYQYASQFDMDYFQNSWKSLIE